MSTKAAGSYGEQLARAYLEEKGYTFLTANWRCKMGEIDLIMQKNTTRVFVEVRLRRPTSFGEGGDTVAYKKQRKLLNSAKLYQQKENYWGDIRFDVVSITIPTPGVGNQSGTPKIEHIEYAFELR